MFQFPGFPAYDYLIHRMLRDSSSRGFPHSEICGSMLICSSPQLIAACHVLRRLPMPRHSPYALLRLNYLQQFVPASLVLASLARIAVFIHCSALSGKIVFFYPTEKPDSGEFLPLSSCFPYFVCHVCLTCFLSNSYDPFSLIRFSMNIRPCRASYTLDSLRVYRKLAKRSGLKWTRTTDLALIRRAL